MRLRYVAQVRDRGAGRRRQHHVCDGSLPTVTFAELQCEHGGADWTDQPVGLPDGHGWLELGFVRQSASTNRLHWEDLAPDGLCSFPGQGNASASGSIRRCVDRLLASDCLCRAECRARFPNLGRFLQ